MAAWWEEALLEEANSPQVPSNHPSLCPKSSMPQGANYWVEPGKWLGQQQRGKYFAYLYCQKSVWRLWGHFSGCSLSLGQGTRSIASGWRDRTASNPQQRWCTPFSYSGGWECISFFSLCRFLDPNRGGRNESEVPLMSWYNLQDGFWQWRHVALLAWTNQLGPPAHFLLYDGNRLQDSRLENLMDREAWQAIVHGVAKIWTRPSN